MTADGAYDLQERMDLATVTGCWWGVDPSTLAVSIGVAVVRDELEGVRRTVRSVSFTPRRAGAARLSLAYSRSRELAHALALKHPPTRVLIEQMAGATVPRELLYAHGAIQAGIFDGVLTATGQRVELSDDAVPGKWKRLACGRGDLYKPKKDETHEYGVLTWARSVGYPGTDWNEADALGIAEAARLLLPV